MNLSLQTCGHTCGQHAVCTLGMWAPKHGLHASGRSASMRRSRVDRSIASQAAPPKTALVTGANSGLGFETASTLAKQGYMVVLACRDLAKAQETKARILQQVPQARLEPQHIDLGNLSTIRAFTEKALSFSGHQLDLLVNNAGVMATPEMRTVDGFEYQMGINHLGHFLLTQSLMPLLTGDRPSRIVIVSSSAHMFGHVNFDDINCKHKYTPWSAYGASKLANVLHAYELARRLTPADNCTVNALHPGIINSNLGRYLLPEQPQWWQQPVIAGLKAFTKSPAQGAKTQLYLATSPEVEGISGKYFVDSQPKTSSDESYHLEVAKKLWDLSAEMVDLKC